MAKYWQTLEFRRLRNEWYKKAAQDSEFKHIEYGTDASRLKSEWRTMPISATEQTDERTFRVVEQAKAVNWDTENDRLKAGFWSALHADVFSFDELLIASASILDGFGTYRLQDLSGMTRASVDKVLASAKIKIAALD